MKNIEIIETYKICNGVTSEIDTFAGWKRRGYSVKKGEKSAIKIDIWRPKKGKVENNEDAEIGEDELKYFYLVQASFFTRDQVEKKAS